MNECSCSMMGTKLEVKMKKAEIGLWTKLEAPKTWTQSDPPKVKQSKGNFKSFVKLQSL